MNLFICLDLLRQTLQRKLSLLPSLIVAPSDCAHQPCWGQFTRTLECLLFLVQFVWPLETMTFESEWIQTEITEESLL